MRKPKLFIALLRIALGWVFLYQGISLIVHTEMTIKPYIENARTFPSLYALFSVSPNLEYITYGVKGLFVIVGILLILGAFARFAAFLGIILTLFFYFPLLHFPYVTPLGGGTPYYIVDEHIIYILILLYLFTVRSGEFLGLSSMFRLSRY